MTSSASTLQFVVVPRRAKPRGSYMLIQEMVDSNTDDTTLTVESHRASALAERIYALDEPWRSRFIEVVASRSSGVSSSRRYPTQTDVAHWLRDQGLYQQVRMMVRAWTQS